MQLKIFLATIFGFGSGSSLTGISSLSNGQYQNIQSIVENYQFGNEEKSNENINLQGQEYGKEFRLYIDSSSDKNLPESNNSDDYIVSKAKKDEWYNHLIKGININVLDYSSSKEEFVKNYGILNINYEYMFNFWNSKEGWTYPGGKSNSYINAGYTYKLKGQNSSELITEKTDQSHSSNERARIVLYEEWNNNQLKIKMHLGTRIHWAWGSVYHHAALAQMKKDEYTFLYNDKNIDIKAESDIVNSSFELGNSKNVSGIEQLDNKLKSKKATYGLATITNQFFFGTKVVENTIYFVQISIIWFPNALINIDASSILMGLPISRALRSDSIGSSYFFTYSNNLGLTEKTNGSILISEIKGTFMLGTTQTFYVYG
ncbi:hypothetical protein [Spiroplasma sp. BIUS-1]|uniref:hypothetical protein n=1 Tax=Spiroplasma sp. BIUS-1 TaxID=216964 RepID=UPI00139821D4|nr:hypothetical protein [Spiroplasma sp. BIUS-1]QHX36574.1 hypothetical protein SBIUS_v1c03210 [Spiroplasma sp. BIUS-1]